MPTKRKPARTTGEFQSQLQEYVVVDEYEIELSGEMDDALELQCPHEDCGETFVVAREGWLTTRYATIDKSTVIIGRPCPYCFSAGAIPAAMRGDQ